MRSSPAATLALVALGVGALPGRTLAQAWLPSPGEGTLTITYQNTLARGELTTDGRLLGDDTVRAHGLVPEVEWGLTNRLALNLTLPFITARYRGDHPHLLNVRGEPKPIDDGTYHSGAQDFRFGLRYGLKTGALAIAPFAEGIIPSHHYESLGHSAIGKDLRGFRAGVNVGRFLDAVAPGLYFHTQLSHTVMQEVAGIRPNRSGLDSEVGYFVTPRFAVRFLESLLITHDGTDFPDPRLSIPIFLLNHDRLQKNKILNLGGGVGFAFTDSLDGFAAVAGIVWGRNVHPHRGITVGMNWHFRAGSGPVSPSRHSGRNVGALRPTGVR
ncbi:MAG: hypothetical protein HY654_10860 [Acidobacteria bacterium]|nr:hypothetical protein [Acidobacteriota bacterium]